MCVSNLPFGHLEDLWHATFQSSFELFSSQSPSLRKVHLPCCDDSYSNYNVIIIIKHTLTHLSSWAWFKFSSSGAVCLPKRLSVTFHCYRKGSSCPRQGVKDELMASAVPAFSAVSFCTSGVGEHCCLWGLGSCESLGSMWCGKFGIEIELQWPLLTDGECSRDIRRDALCLLLP